MQWIKEVELVDSVDELRSSTSSRGTSMPNFEVLDARIAPALNKIIHNSHFKRRISLEEQKAQKQDRFLRGRQIAQWFCRKLHRPVYYWSSKWWYLELDSKWDEILLSMTENPIWWYIGRILQTGNTRVWDTQDCIGLVWRGDSSEEIRTWISHIENGCEKKYRTICPNHDFWGQEWRLWDDFRGRESWDKTAWTGNLEDCWRWKANGQCSKGDGFRFRHGVDERVNFIQPSPSPSFFDAAEWDEWIENLKS